MKVDKNKECKGLGGDPDSSDSGENSSVIKERQAMQTLGSFAQGVGKAVAAETLLLCFSLP